MTEEQEVPKEEPVTPEAPTPEPAAAEPEPAGSGQEVEEGKVFAVLSYALNFVGIPFFLVPLIMRNNEFSLYHAKQSLLIWLAALVTGLVNVIPCLGQIVWLVAVIFLAVLNIMGLINASKSIQKPVPLIGQWAEDWFKGLRKV